MAGRAKPNWVMYVGGPLDGHRIIHAGHLGPATTRAYTSGTTEGMRVPHEYAVTSEYRAGGVNEAKARVLAFRGTLPEEPCPPPPPPYVSPMSVWMRPVHPERQSGVHDEMA
ncbi:MAG TPA: hypothetical protein PLX89_27960 [Verrucomicrobiota bacterium]|nr:hypothetical protein [Verrucomicrobiota bacterium]